MRRGRHRRRVVRVPRARRRRETLLRRAERTSCQGSGRHRDCPRATGDRRLPRPPQSPVMTLAGSRIERPAFRYKVRLRTRVSTLNAKSRPPERRCTHLGQVAAGPSMRTGCPDYRGTGTRRRDTRAQASGRRPRRPRPVRSAPATPSSQGSTEQACAAIRCLTTPTCNTPTPQTPVDGSPTIHIHEVSKYLHPSFSMPMTVYPLERSTPSGSPTRSPSARSTRTRRCQAAGQSANANRASSSCEAPTSARSVSLPFATLDMTCGGNSW